MRHRIAGKQLCRDSEHRRAMLRNLAAGLFEHGQIETTMPKAKAVQPFVEKIITLARQGTDLTTRRRLEVLLNDRKIHAWVADPAVGDEHKDNAWFELPDADDIKFNRYGDVKKAPRLVQHVLTKIAPLFEGRDGGYTRIVKLSKRRLGDGTDLVLLQLVGREEGAQVSGGGSRRREQADNRTAWFAKIKKDAGIKDGPAAGTAASTAAAATATAEAEPPPAPDAAPPDDAGESKTS